MPTVAQMSKAIGTLIKAADLALLKHKCNDADAACKALLKYHNDHLSELPSGLDAMARDAIVRLSPQVERCFLKWGRDA